MENIKEKRLVRLLDATLLYHCEEITLLDDTSLYDAMFKYLEEGELDRVFLCPKLKDASKEERKKALDIARKHSYLCFYEGNRNFWEDSAEGYKPGFFSEFIAEEILDNYNFLVELAHEKGETAVEELTNFVSEEMAIESSVVDYLRNTFNNDNLLKVVLDTTSREDSIYGDLTPKRKRILYRYPKEVLYTEYQEIDESDFMIIPKEELFNRISIEANDSTVLSMNKLSEIADYLGDEDFERTIRNVHLLNSEKKETGAKHR